MSNTATPSPTETSQPAPLPPDPPAETGDLRKKAVRGGAIFFVGKFGVQLVSAAMSLVTYRLLLPSDLGMMSAAMLFVGLTDMLAEAGLGKTLVQKKTVTPRDIAQCFTLSLIMSGSLYAILFFGAGFAAQFGTLETADNPEIADTFAFFLRVVGLVTFTIPFRTVPLALLERDMRFGRQSTMFVISALTQLVVVFTLAWNGFGYWALAAGMILGRCFELLVLSFLCHWTPRLAVPGPESTEILRFGLSICGASLLWYVYQRSDVAILKFWLRDDSTLGLFAIAQTLISMPVEKLSTTMNTIMFPVYCKLRDDPDRLRSWFLRMTSLLGFITLPTMFGIMLVAEDAILVLLADRWRGAIDPVRILSPVGCVMVFAVLIPPLLNALGRPHLNLYYNIAQTLLMPASFLVGVALDGMLGVCWAWLFVYPIIVAGMIEMTKSLTRVGVWDLLKAQWPNLFGVAAMATVVIALQLNMADVARPWRLIVAIAAGAATFAAWILLVAKDSVLGDLRTLLREMRGQSAPE